MTLFKANMEYINSDTTNILRQDFIENFFNIFCESIRENKDIVFVCIGTEKQDFDSFGPIIGTLIEEQLKHIPNIRVYGKIGDNINALNGKEKIKEILQKEKNSIIIGVDASASYSRKDIRNIRLSSGSIFPGAANNKNLGAVGDYSVTMCSCIVKATETGKYKIDFETACKINHITEASFFVVESINDAYEYIIQSTTKNYI